MFKTSITLSTVSVIADSADIRKLVEVCGFERNGTDKVVCYGHISPDGKIHLSGEWDSGARKRSFSRTSNRDKWRLNLGKPPRNLVETHGGWNALLITPEFSTDNTLSFTPPIDRVRAEHFRTPGSGASRRSSSKKVEGRCVATFWTPDDGRVIYPNLPMSEILELMTTLAVKGYAKK